MLKSFLTFFIAFPALFFPVEAVRADNVGLIASLSGNVQVMRAPGAKSVKASVMQSLAPGSKISVAPGGRATVILFQDGARYELSPGSVTSVAANSCQGLSGPAPKSLAALPIRQRKLLASSQVASGRAASTTMRGPEQIGLQSLSATSISQARPVFEWGAVQGAASYQVQLWDENNEMVWQGESSATRLVYPENAPALQAETDYQWIVTTLIGEKPLKGEGVFRILNGEKIAAANAELAALDPALDEALAGVLRAEIFARYELWDDAIATYQQLAAKFPDSQTIDEALTQLLFGQARATKTPPPQNAPVDNAPVDNAPVDAAPKATGALPPVQ